MYSQYVLEEFMNFKISLYLRLGHKEAAPSKLQPIGDLAIRSIFCKIRQMDTETGASKKYSELYSTN
jgi:hypothetical protein